MGFYLGNTYQTAIDLSESEKYTKGIEIFNNETIDFSAKDVIISSDIIFLGVENSEETLVQESYDTILPEQSSFKVEDCLYKIKIDYGDGEKDTLIRPIKNNDGSWLSFSHHYCFENFSDNAIKITLYNFYGFAAEIEIPFKVKKTSLQSQGLELELVTVNLDNNKNVSYVFNEASNNQIILAKMRK